MADITSLDKAISEIKKQFGNDSIGFVNDMDVDVKRITTGSPFIDWSLFGGFPLGKLIELYGPYSSGKSLISYRTIAEAQKRGKTCILFDAENAFDPTFAVKLGLDTSKLVLCNDSLGESMFDKLILLLQAEPEIIVVDSVASLVPKAEFEDPMEQQTIGLHARMMSKALRKVNAMNKSTCLIFINQIREKPTAYGNPETTTGGRALPFYASIRLEIRRGEFITNSKKEKIGQEIKFKVVKSKVSQPFRDGSIRYYYDTCTFDAKDELISLGLINDKIKRRGAWYDVAGESFQGREELEAKLKDPAFFEKIKKEVMI